MAYQNTYNSHYGNSSSYRLRQQGGGQRAGGNGGSRGNYGNHQRGGYNRQPAVPAEMMPVEDAMKLISPYLTKEDHRVLARNLDTSPGKSWPAQAVRDAVSMAEHLRGKGLDFKVAENRFPDQIDVKLPASGMTVRLFDGSNPGLIGRVSDGKRYYHYTKRTGGIPEVPLSLKKAVLDVAMGNVPGSVFRNKTPSSSNTGRKEYNYWVPLKSRPDIVLSINTNGRQEKPFTNAETARRYIDDSIKSAKREFMAGIDMGGILDAIEAGEEPKWSRRDNFADMQYGFYETMLGVKAAQEEGRFDENGFLDVDAQDPDQVFYDYGLKEPVFAQDWRQYGEFLVRGFVDSNMGSYEEGFNPVYVAEYMDSGYSGFRNSQDMVAAIKEAGGDLSNIQGTDFYLNRLADQLIRFDPETAVDADHMGNPLGKAALESVCSTLEDSGVAFDRKDIAMDENGVISWKGKRRIADRKGGKNAELEPEELSGTIGQVFLPDERGVVETKYAGSDNYLFVPGYEAYVQAGDGPFMDRVRLKGYQDVVCQAVRRAVKSDLMSEGPVFDSATALNNTYSHLYERRFPLDYMENNDLSPEELDAVLGTLSRRVRFPSEYEGSTVRAHLDAEMGVERDKDAPEGTFSYYNLTGGKDLSLLEEDSYGYFDKWATGTAKTQGLVRYLTTDAKVGPDGRIAKGDHEHCPLMELDLFGKKEYNAWDRCQMSFGQMLTAKKVARGVNACFTDMGGWNFDDAYVVSEDFARANAVEDTSGNKRPLKRGDKLSDFNGNKGAISFIVPSWAKDLKEIRETDPEGYQEKIQWARDNHVLDLVNMFAANPDLDVIGSPYSVLSRANTGLIREMQEHPQPLTDPFHGNRVVEGGMGKINMIVTDMTVDEKTHLYENPGDGRKFSSQLAWACASKGADNIMAEAYGNNTNAFENFREYLVCLGLDITPTGELRDKYTPQEGEERHVFEPTIVRKKDANGNPLAWADRAATEKGFMDEIAHRGGMLRLPFPLKFPTGEQIPAAGDKKGGYLLPVLSSDLRAERQIIDGQLRAHDFTSHYGKVYMSMMDWMEAKGRLAGVEEALAKGGLSKEEWTKMTKSQAALTESMSKAEAQAQAGFDSITRQVIEFQIDGENGKHSFLRDNIMSHKVSNTATLVATSDPRLSIHQVGMPGNVMEKLGVKDGESVLMWRDPVLKDGAMRYLEVVRDDTLTGFAVNPFIGKSQGLDYDGDSEGAMKLKTKGAREDAKRYFTVAANVLDPGSGNPGEQSLYFNNGCDFAAAAWATKGARTAEGKADIANDLGMYRKWIEKSANVGSNIDYGKHLDAYVKKCYQKAHCNDILLCGSPEDTMRSLGAMVEKGAKGNEKALKKVARYLGVEYEGTPGNITAVKDTGVSQVTDKERQVSQLANAVKVSYTGSAGSISQKAAAAMLDTKGRIPGIPVMAAALNTTEPVTQAVLDMKKCDDIKIATGLVKGLSDINRVWEGQAEGSGNRKRQMTVDEFEKSMRSVMEDQLHVPVNQANVRVLAEAMRQPDGTVAGLSKMPVSALCRVAYGGGFEALVDEAKKGSPLFDMDGFTGGFAPKSVREGNPFQNMAKADTLSDDKLAEIGRLSERRGPDMEWRTQSSRYGAGYMEKEGYVPPEDLDAQLARKEAAREAARAAEEERIASMGSDELFAELEAASAAYFGGAPGQGQPSGQAPDAARDVREMYRLGRGGSVSQERMEQVSARQRPEDASGFVRADEVRDVARGGAVRWTYDVKAAASHGSSQEAAPDQDRRRNIGDMGDLV